MVAGARWPPGWRPSRWPLGVIGLLGAGGAIHAEVAVAIALTSTALGTLLPILKDSGHARHAASVPR